MFWTTAFSMRVLCTDRSARLRVKSAAHSGMDFPFSSCIMRRGENDEHELFRRASERGQRFASTTALCYLHTEIDRGWIEPAVQHAGGTTRSCRSVYSEPAACGLDRDCRTLR